LTKDQRQVNKAAPYMKEKASNQQQAAQGAAIEKKAKIQQ
jgi:hypothetical protein